MAPRFLAMIQVSDVIVLPDGEVIGNECAFPLPGEHETEAEAFAAGERYATLLLERGQIDSPNPYKLDGVVDVQVSVVRRYSRDLPVRAGHECPACGVRRHFGDCYNVGKCPRSVV